MALIKDSIIPYYILILRYNVVIFSSVNFPVVSGGYALIAGSAVAGASSTTTESPDHHVIQRNPSPEV